MPQHKFLPKPPKRLAVVDQNSCSGCAGSPACVTYCETVTVKEKVVDAIRTVDWPGSPFELAVVEYDKCIGCGICAVVCPWDAITMYSYEEGLKVAPELTLVDYEEPGREQEPARENPAGQQRDPGAPPSAPVTGETAGP